MVQEVLISGDRYWAGRDRLGRHIRLCLSSEEAVSEVALWNVEITEMQESTKSVASLHVIATGIQHDGVTIVTLERFLCVDKQDQSKASGLCSTHAEALRDLRLGEERPSGPGF